MNTKRNIHSHSGFHSPVSGRQEVSAFGDEGDGDQGIFHFVIIVFRGQLGIRMLQE